jgi:hypothetical protein
MVLLIVYAFVLVSIVWSLLAFRGCVEICLGLAAIC